MYHVLVAICVSIACCYILSMEWAKDDSNCDCECDD
jgi:hypothetical protein